MLYGNVSNLLEIAKDGRAKKVPIEVNTTLFSVMDKLGVPVHSRVTLYLDFERGGWLFGISVDENEIFDLWRYRSNALPDWLGLDSL